MVTQPGDTRDNVGNGMGDNVSDKVRESLQAVSFAQSALPHVQAALAAGRAPAADDLAKLTKAASALAEAANVLGLEPGQATLTDLKAELAARESTVRLRPVLRRLAHAAGPGGGGLQPRHPGRRGRPPREQGRLAARGRGEGIDARPPRRARRRGGRSV